LRVKGWSGPHRDIHGHRSPSRAVMNSAGKASHVASASGLALPAVPAAEAPDHSASAARIDAHEPATGVFPTLLRSPVQSPITGMDAPFCVVSASFALVEGGCVGGHAVEVECPLPGIEPADAVVRVVRVGGVEPRCGRRFARGSLARAASATERVVPLRKGPPAGGPKASEACPRMALPPIP